jgi:hypothetical protein
MDDVRLVDVIHPTEAVYATPTVEAEFSSGVREG